MISEMKETEPCTADKDGEIKERTEASQTSDLDQNNGDIGRKQRRTRTKSKLSHAKKPKAQPPEKKKVSKTRSIRLDDDSITCMADLLTMKEFEEIMSILKDLNETELAILLIYKDKRVC